MFEGGKGIETNNIQHTDGTGDIGRKENTDKKGYKRWCK